MRWSVILMSNTTNSDSQEVKKLIFNWLIKAGIIFTFAFLVIEILIPRLLQKTSSNLEDLEVSTTGVSMKFSSDGKFKELKIINVPAYQPGVFSGVKLEKDKIIKIQATGLVATGGTFPIPEQKNSDKNDQTQDNSDENSKWIEAFKQLKLNADFQVAWRDPNGEFLFTDQEKLDKKCLPEVADRRRLEKQLPYGYLLGVIVDLGPDKDETKAAVYQLQRINNNDKSLLFALVNKQGSKVGEIKKIIAIGQKATIKFNNIKNEYEVEGEDLSSFDKSSSLRSSSAESSESYIYFVVNDTLLESKHALTNIENEFITKENPKACFDEIGLEYNQQKDNKLKAVDWEGEIWNYQKQLYPTLLNPSSLWFLNNKGSFSVTIIEIKK